MSKEKLIKAKLKEVPRLMSKFGIGPGWKGPLTSEAIELRIISTNSLEIPKKEISSCQEKMGYGNKSTRR